MIPRVLGSFASLPRPHRPIRAANGVFPLPVEEKAPPEASTCSKPQRQGGVINRGAPTLFPLPVDEKAIMNNTPDTRACDGHFPLPVKGKATPLHRALQSPAEPRGRSSSVPQSPVEPSEAPWRPSDPCAHPMRLPFHRSLKGKGNRKRTLCFHDCLFPDRP